MISAWHWTKGPWGELGHVEEDCAERMITALPVVCDRTAGRSA